MKDINWDKRMANVSLNKYKTYQQMYNYLYCVMRS
jgi:hypothetical protein